ncbi:T-Complex Protein 11 X-Linked Protein 2 [Manis pentadactyla]|nr:T-Complex Protein 11 X-Linked Protein 2 [Manis pentadactyla]
MIGTQSLLPSAPSQMCLHQFQITSRDPGLKKRSSKMIPVKQRVESILLPLLLPRQNCTRNEIEEALDMHLLKQETDHGALDVPHLSSYILNLMNLLCAPVRDEAMQKLENDPDNKDVPEVGNVCESFAFLFGIQPLHPNPPLLKAHSSLPQQTLLMDRTRLQEMESQLHQLTFLASVVSEEAMLSVSEQVSQEIHQGLRDRGFTDLSSENAASLIGQLQNIVKKDNCVRSIIGKSPPQDVVARVGKNGEDELVDTALEVSSQTT